MRLTMTWREIAYLRPRSWTRTVIGGIMFGCAFKVAMKSVVMPLFGAAREPGVPADVHHPLQSLL